MWKKYTIRVFFFVALLSLAVASFNWMVNPFDIFNSPTIAGFNMNKPEAYTQQRVYKAAQLINRKPKIVILGTSRTDRGIDPDNMNLGNSVFNASINGMTPTECEYLLDAAIRNDVKYIIIGLDFYTFYFKDSIQNGFDKDILTNSRAWKYILSIDAIKSSFITIVSQKETVLYTKNGLRTSASLQLNSDKDGGHKKIFHNSEKMYLTEVYSKKISRFQNIHWNAFERSLNEAHKNNINVTLFISPSHARQWEVLAMAQGWKIFEEYKKKLVAINEKVAIENGKKPFPLWDFTGYHTLTTESIPCDSTKKMSYYWDGSHYKKKLGDIVLDRMFDGNFSGGQDYYDFGVKLTSKNIKTHLAQIQIQREYWRSKHPKDLSEIEALAK